MGENYVKLGYIKGGKISVPVRVAGSQQLKARSGRFVYLDSNGRANLNTDGSTRIFGHLEETGIASFEQSTTQDDEYNCIIDFTAIFRIPINSGTLARGMTGDLCDISISSNIQGAQLDASSENTLVVVDGDFVGNTYVDVMINSQKWGTDAGVEA